MEKFFADKLSRAGFNSLEIVKTPVATKVVVKVAKPGLAIGYSGKNIKYLSEKLEKDFGFKNPHIEVKSIDHPEYDVNYKISSIIANLEKGSPWRQVFTKAVAELSTLPLMGFELMFKGTLMAKGGRKQKYRFPFGYMKKGGDQKKFVIEGKGDAHTKAGAIGVTLRIIPPNVVFPDKISKDDIKNAVNRVYRGIGTETTDVSKKDKSQLKVAEDEQNE